VCAVPGEARNGVELVGPPTYTGVVRSEDLDELSGGWLAFFGALYFLGAIRAAILFLFVLGVAIACIVVGSPLGRIVGVVLLAGCVLVAAVTARRHSRGR
jgi:hypothetical protein